MWVPGKFISGGLKEYNIKRQIETKDLDIKNQEKIIFYRLKEYQKNFFKPNIWILKTPLSIHKLWDHKEMAFYEDLGKI